MGYLVLELAGVSAADGDNAAIDVELADDWGSAFELGSEGLRWAATQAQQADQNILLWVLVGEEGLPAPVGHIVPPHQLHLRMHKGNQEPHDVPVSVGTPSLQASRYLVRSDFVMDLLNAHFSGSDISTLHTKHVGLFSRSI